MTDINPNSRASFVDGRGRLTRYGMDVINKLYRILNVTGDNSALSDANDTNLFLSSSAVVKDDPELITTSSSFTTYTTCFVNVTSQSTVTLNPFPSDGERATVHKNTGQDTDYVDVTDGTGTDRLYVDQTVISYAYNIELNQWVRGG